MAAGRHAPLVLAVIALVVAFVALALSVQRDGPDAPPEIAEIRDDALRRDIALSQSVERLEKAVERLGGRIDRDRDHDRAAPPPGAERAEAPESVQTDLTERLAQLEKRVAEQEKRAPNVLERLLGERDADVEDVPALQEQARDTTLPSEDRLKALRKLRRLPRGRSPEVVAAMIELYRLEQDAEIRTDIWRQLSGVTQPQLLQPLIDSLQNDPARKVREEAVETLSDFSDAAAREAIEFAAENDPDEDVREEALKRLGRSGRRR